MRLRHAAAFALPLSLALTACEAPSPEELVDDDTLEAVPEGKEDNYLSTTGREYDLKGTDSVTVEPNLTGTAALERAKQLVGYRMKALSWFTYQYVTTKEHEESNYSYGGFNALVRQASFAADKLTAGSNGTFSYPFTAEIAGPTTLLNGKWLTREGTKRSFVLQLPKLSNSELESGSYARTYKEFDPSKLTADKLEKRTIEIALSPPSIDAYPDYSALFADGKLDIAIHVGGDYNDSRHDLQTAKAIFEQLKTAGFTAPAASMDALTLSSGPFKKSIQTPKGPVAVEVYLYQPDMAGTDYQKLVDAYKASAKTRDVVIYDGHAGYDSSYSGVVVKYNPRVALAAEEFSKLQLASKYQLFVFNGCKTYGMYADQLYKNAAKTTKTLDVISTVNFSWLGEMPRITSALVGGLTKTTTQGHFPLAYGALLNEMNKGQSTSVMYGVHGLDDNAHVSPWASATTGKTCTAQTTCGSADTACVKPTGAACKVCAPACTDDSGCPTGTKCQATASTSTSTLAGRQCVTTKPQCK